MKQQLVNNQRMCDSFKSIKNAACCPALYFKQPDGAKSRSLVSFQSSVAQSNYGQLHFKNRARRIRRWGEQYYTNQSFEVSRRGRHEKTKSLINDEDVRLGLKAYLRGQKPESITVFTWQVR